MYGIQRCLLAVVIAAAITLSYRDDAEAGYPYVVAPAPAVVGYTAQRRGIFGQRVVMRPVVAPVAATVAVARPVVTVARPVVSVARPVVSAYYAPPVSTVSAYYAPPVAPVAAYYAPPIAPVVSYRVPVVRTYRVPIVYGW